MRTLKILIILAVLMTSCPLSAEEKSEYEYLLIVDISKRNLTHLTGDSKTEIASYPIAVPKNDWLPLPLVGEVKRIEFNPWWYPTPKTRIALKEKGVELPKAIRPGDPKNAMGKVKIVIQFENFKPPIRIHGTNDPSSIGKRVSRGCIRMYNEDVLNLAKIIKNSRIKVIIK